MESNVSRTGPSNFAFLPPTFQAIAATATQAESHIYGDPRAACFHARFTLESIVYWLYRHDRALQMPYDQKLGALIYEPSFQNLLPQAVYQKTKLIHRIGNQAVHKPQPISTQDALQIVKDLHHLRWIPEVGPEVWREKLRNAGIHQRTTW